MSHSTRATYALMVTIVVLVAVVEWLVMRVGRLETGLGETQRRTAWAREQEFMELRERMRALQPPEMPRVRVQRPPDGGPPALKPASPPWLLPD